MFKWRGNKPNKGDSPAQKQEEDASQISAQLMRNFIERMISDAQQMAEEIKNQARMEAEKEARDIVRKAASPSGDAASTETAPEDIVPESPDAPAAAEPEVQPEDAQPEPVETEQTDEPVIAEIETSEAEETPAAGQETLKATADTEEAESLPMDSTAIFNGDVELVISVPVDPVAVSRLYNKLQSTPDMKILYTSGSWDKGTIITVSLEKPLPLLGIISNIPGVNVKRISGDDKSGVKASSLLGGSKSPSGRINLSLKAM